MTLVSCVKWHPITWRECCLPTGPGRRLDKAFKQSSSGHLMVLVAFCLFVSLGFYVLYKAGKFVKFFTG